MKKNNNLLLILGLTAILSIGNTSESWAKISCVFSNNNAKVTISGKGSDVASASACNTENSSSTDDGWEYNSDWKNSVKDINIGNGVTSVGGYAFSGMNGVTSLTISDSVTKIGEGAFNGMSGVTSLTIPNSVKSIGGIAFMGMSGVQGQLVIPNSVTSLAGRAFEGMSGVTSLVIPEGVTEIGSAAFYGMSGVTGELKIPKGVTEIEGSAFYGMSGVTSLNIPKSVTSIGSLAFSGMSGVTGELVIPDSVTTIGDDAFSGMRGVTGELEIPDSVTSIGRSAFSGMSGVTSLIIPDSVTSVGDTAFWGMKEVLIPDTLVVTDDWKGSAFHNSVNIRCLGDLDKCINALKKYLPESQGGSCTNPNYCLNINKIVPVTQEQCGGVYAWNEATGKCNRMTEWQCNDYRDENNERKYYFNGNTCTKLPKNGKISCVNACYKINDGYCDRVCYTPAEAAEIAKDSGNVVTLTFKKQ